MLAAIARFKNLSARDEDGFDRLGQIENLVFVAPGKDDLVIPSINSFVMQQNLPNARLKGLSDSGHGFLCQFAEKLATDVNACMNAGN